MSAAARFGTSDFSLPRSQSGENLNRCTALLVDSEVAFVSRETLIAANMVSCS